MYNGEKTEWIGFDFHDHDHVYEPDPNLDDGIPANVISLSTAVIGEVGVFLMHFPKKGTFYPEHRHPYEHALMLVAGSFMVKVDGKENIFKAPKILYIAKETEHEIYALEDKSVACCLSNAVGQESVIPASSIPPSAKHLVPSHLIVDG